MINILNRFFKKNKIKAKSENSLNLNIIDSKKIPPFFSNDILKKNILSENSFLKEHVINILNNGFTVVQNDISNDLINLAVDDFYSWKKRNNKFFKTEFFKFEDKLDRIINLHTAVPSLNYLFLNSKSNIVLDFLLNSNTSLYSSLFFEVGSSQEPHVDLPLFWTNPAYMYFGTWLALEDIDGDNGPLIVYPRSHKVDLPNVEEILFNLKKKSSEIQSIDQDLWDFYQSKLLLKCNEKGIKPVEVHVKKGDRIIWHPLLLHGGKQILDNKRTRLSFVNHVTPYNTPVYHMDAFFNKEKEVEKVAPWEYEQLNGRYIAKMNIQLNHVADYDYTKLR